MTHWSTFSAVVAGADTETLIGSRSMESARAAMSRGMVAENSSVWRFAGSVARMKPMSSMRSASSRTSTSTAPSLACPCPMRSSKRPGVATRMSTPRASAETCGPWPTPPKITARDMPRFLP